MISEPMQTFLRENHNGILTTFRKTGSAQMSIVTCGLIQQGVTFSTVEGSAKYANLRRDPRCSLLVSAPNWRRYLVLEGEATVLSSQHTDPEELRLTLREVYRAASGNEHPNWEEYDQAMVDGKRVAVIVIPKHTYGTAI
tara:strand:- start:291 stop:710 length:420 start_codon:yes stop_codon:yes gene_type:complete